MFGLHAIYIDDRIVFMLRHKKDKPEMNGVWVATSETHHESLKVEFTSLTSISAYSDDTVQSGWQVLPEMADDFEQSIIHLCKLIKRGDPRIGKIPAPRKKKK